MDNMMFPVNLKRPLKTRFLSYYHQEILFLWWNRDLVHCTQTRGQNRAKLCKPNMRSKAKHPNCISPDGQVA